MPWSCTRGSRARRPGSCPSVNRATLQMARALGLDADEAGLLGRRLEEVTAALWPSDGDDGDGVLDDFYRAAESGRTADARGPACRRAATRCSRRADAHPVLRPGRADAGTCLAVVRDITARKRAEAARREFEARLAQSRKMEALGQLAGGVAHDFNNILTGILGFADVIRRSTPDPAAAGFSGGDRAGRQPGPRPGPPDPDVQPSAAGRAPAGSPGRMSARGLAARPRDRPGRGPH